MPKEKENPTEETAAGGIRLGWDDRDSETRGQILKRLAERPNFPPAPIFCPVPTDPSLPSLAPAKFSQPGVAEKFASLAKTWKDETGIESSPARLACHPAYKRIVDMGWAIVPLLLRDLESFGGLWFDALVEITQKNPVPPEQAGQVEEMRKCWVSWGKQAGFL
ncbi:MAG: hypothetical protein HYZ53_29175 [Planctomycetes bacterium]|nr:hypothetical protein [Planctomycetota bacterium]